MAQAKELNVIDNPLVIAKEIAAELKLPVEADVSPFIKIRFLQAQLEEFQSQAWRSLVDAVHARRLIQSDVEAISSKGHQNLAEHKNAALRLSEGIVMTQNFIEQLRKEYPELQIED